MMARCGGKARKAVFKQLFGRIEIIGAFEQKVTVSMTLTNKGESFEQKIKPFVIKPYLYQFSG